MKERLFVVMGVAGCGKSTIGAAVAEKAAGIYIDGDHLHPKSNIEKMSRGEALNDDDRWPWLEKVGSTLAGTEGLVFIGCSALKKSYRDLINAQASEPVRYIFLSGSKALIATRMASRDGHFMPTSLLDSQFDTLEPPDITERMYEIDISGSQDKVVELITNRLADQRD